MASTLTFLGRRSLQCFYCNQRSAIKYDGRVTKWECGHCEAFNHLDSNGSIADPTVTSTSDLPAPLETRYSLSRPGSTSVKVSADFQRQPSEHEVFCSTCQKNQHLFTSSLAQYDVETDPEAPNYKQSERAYFKYRRELEKRYPQCCEDCEPKVLGKMTEASKTAKSDFLRKSLDRTHAMQKSAGVSLYSTILFVANLFWYFGILLQLAWHFKTLGAVIASTYSVALDYQLPASITIFLSELHTCNLPKVGLCLSLMSIWWNPKYRDWDQGHRKHLRGLWDWYKFQFLNFGFRLFIYTLVNTHAIVDDIVDAPYAPPSLVAHLLSLVVVLHLTFAGQNTITIYHDALFDTPTKVANVGPSARPPPPPVTSQTFLDAMGGRQANTRAPPKIDPKFFIDPNKKYQELESMDWQPHPQSPPQHSQHRAFQPNQPHCRSSQLFGQAPIAEERGPFWYKVPPAPITPAQSLRNPPNQPRLRATPQEPKVNFFQPRQTLPIQPTEKIGTIRRKEPTNIEFTQQRFFPPDPQEEDDLAGLLGSMGSFTLRAPEEVIPPLCPNTTVFNITETVGKVLGFVLIISLALFWSGVIKFQT
ncbi:Ima1 N-terminal domain-containing protein [Calycina marina]|uniref:Ima1 N-terminal domain-containing protein n=1 Tax=Calycina marina TaxID=1763456 RepID=A0A9P7Z446_9HELO|nr:Ima1 N-terminal domain-containing protein [Calycina marina]